MNNKYFSSLLMNVVEIARGAASVVKRHYEANTQKVWLKNDNSPVTTADCESQAFLISELNKITPEIPIISEESDLPEYSVRSKWTKFWLIDPLDGTKEYLSKNGEFTVNVALIEYNEPVLGVISLPAFDRIYFAEKNMGSWKQIGYDVPVRIYSRRANTLEQLVIVESRSHYEKKVEDFVRKMNIKQRIKVGSSLKFCLVAESTADLYPRFGPMMEWDSAAGDCIYRNSARKGINKTSLVYNKPVMRHEGFIIGLENCLPKNVILGGI